MLWFSERVSDHEPSADGLPTSAGKGLMVVSYDPVWYSHLADEVRECFVSLSNILHQINPNLVRFYRMKNLEAL